MYSPRRVNTFNPEETIIPTNNIKQEILSNEDNGCVFADSSGTQKDYSQSQLKQVPPGIPAASSTLPLSTGMSSWDSATTVTAGMSREAVAAMATSNTQVITADSYV